MPKLERLKEAGIIRLIDLLFVRKPQAASSRSSIGVVDQGEVNAQSITGAVCIYVLLGILFLFLYSATALLGSGAFFAQGTNRTRSLRLYFSFVTLATLGYGDFTRAGDLGRTPACSMR